VLSHFLKKSNVIEVVVIRERLLLCGGFWCLGWRRFLGGGRGRGVSYGDFEIGRIGNGAG
jgi:hypothetical protein